MLRSSGHVRALSLTCISCKVYYGKMHTKGPLIPRRRKIIKLCRDGCQKVSMKNMARSKHTELNKIVHYMIQVTGIILFKAYIIYCSYGSNHVFCKQIQTGLKWLYSAQKYKAISLLIIWDFNEMNNFDQYHLHHPFYFSF